MAEDSFMHRLKSRKVDVVGKRESVSVSYMPDIPPTKIEPGRHGRKTKEKEISKTVQKLKYMKMSSDSDDSEEEVEELEQETTTTTKGRGQSDLGKLVLEKIKKEKEMRMNKNKEQSLPPRPPRPPMSFFEEEEESSSSPPETPDESPRSSPTKLAKAMVIPISQYSIFRSKNPKLSQNIFDESLVRILNIFNYQKFVICARADIGKILELETLIKEYVNGKSNVDKELLKLKKKPKKGDIILVKRRTKRDFEEKVERTEICSRFQVSELVDKKTIQGTFVDYLNGLECRVEKSSTMRLDSEEIKSHPFYSLMVVADNSDFDKEINEYAKNEFAKEIISAEYSMKIINMGHEFPEVALYTKKNERNAQTQELKEIIEENFMFA